MEALRANELRMEFDALFLQFSRSLDILMPDPSVDKYLDDFKFMGAVREGARNLYIEQILAPIDINSQSSKKI